MPIYESDIWPRVQQLTVPGAHLTISEYYYDNSVFEEIWLYYPAVAAVLSLEDLAVAEIDLGPRLKHATGGSGWPPLYLRQVSMAGYKEGEDGGKIFVGVSLENEWEEREGDLYRIDLSAIDDEEFEPESHPLETLAAPLSLWRGDPIVTTGEDIGRVGTEPEE